MALASVVGKHGGIYASHIRDEGDTLIESIEEVIEIGKRREVARSRVAFEGEQEAQLGQSASGGPRH